jgi:hypothetical protein
MVIISIDHLLKMALTIVRFSSVISDGSRIGKVLVIAIVSFDQAAIASRSSLNRSRRRSEWVRSNLQSFDPVHEFPKECLMTEAYCQSGARNLSTVPHANKRRRIFSVGKVVEP